MAEVNLEQLLNCALCPNMCRCDCPVLQALGREAVAPSGKARLALMLQQENLAWGEAILEALSNCLGCRGCTVLCPFPELNLCDELLHSRQPAREAGAVLNSCEPYLSNIRKYSSPYGQKSSTKYGHSGKAEVLFFAGCTTLANNLKALEAARSLFDKASVAYQMIEEDCCGYPAESWGDQELARKLAAENRIKILNSGASIMVTNCPECWFTFTERYPSWDQNLPLQIIDGPTYYLSLIRDGRLKPDKDFPEKVYYHDPCIWARTAKKVEQPRAILEAIPGIELLEVNKSGESTRCCGGGNMFQLSFPKTAALIARRRLQDFQPGIPIITACPFCREGLLEEKRDIWELAELLDLSCSNR